MIAYRNNATDPFFSLALEEVLLRNTTDDVFMLWRNSPAVVIGRHQVANVEVNLALADQLQIPVVRRITGGGAVYHDFGTINFSFITTLTMSWEALLQMIVSHFGIKVSPLSGNDVTIGGSKIIGTAQYVIGHRRLFHGSLLFDTDLNTLNNILTPAEEKLQRHGVSSVRARVANLNLMLSILKTTEEFMEILGNGMRRDTRSALHDIPQKYVIAAQELAEEKYRSAEWTNRLISTEESIP